MTGNLTRVDVARLLSDPSPRARADTAAKVATQLDVGSLSPQEWRIAEDIVRAVARDASDAVREALAINIKASRNLPRDVALTLARDIDRVALPILEFSEALADDDLIALIHESNETRQLAIARRGTVSGEVADALIATDNVNVVVTLVDNRGAVLDEATLSGLVERYGEVEGVQGAMVRRPHLPVAVAEELVTRLSDHLRDYLVTHHELSADTASELVLRARERAILSFVSNRAGDGDVVRLAARLARNRRLTPSLVLRALCVGDMAFFEAAMSVLARVPVENARVLIHDAGPLGLKSLYDKTGLPLALLSTVRTAVAIVTETSHGDGEDRELYSRTMIERILTQCVDMRPEDADYLLRKLDDLAAGGAPA